MSDFTNANPLADVTLAILAGGEGSRMGMPKALLKIDGQPILDHLFDRLAWPGKTMLVTAPGREHPPGWQHFTCEVCDPASGGGPLRGVLTALENLTTPLLLVLTVDMPGIETEQCLPLLDHLRQSPHLLGAMMRRMIAGQWQIEPFPFALRAEARSTVAKRLAENRRSVHGLTDEVEFAIIGAPAGWDNRVWTNLNKPSDLASTALDNTLQVNAKTPRTPREKRQENSGEAEECLPREGTKDAKNTGGN